MRRKYHPFYMKYNPTVNVEKNQSYLHEYFFEYMFLQRSYARIQIENKKKTYQYVKSYEITNLNSLNIQCMTLRDVLLSGVENF